MANIKKITLPSGTTYDIVDQGARDLISELSSYTDYLGVTTTALTDGATTNPITISGASVTAKTGNIVNYNSSEFIFNGTSWQLFGDLSGLGDLAFKDSATGSFTPHGSVSVSTNGTTNKTATVSTTSGTATYTPGGTVSQPTFTGSALTSSGSFTPSGTVSVSTNATANKTATVSAASSGTATYTPAGTVSTPTITVTPSTATVNSITAVGTLPSFTATVANETLTLGFSQGTLPTKGSNQTVVTGISSATSSQPTFTGTGARLVTGNIPVPSTYTASFTGTAGDVSVSGTPSGTVSQPTFSGTGVRLVTGNIAVPSTYTATFTGTTETVEVD